MSDIATTSITSNITGENLPDTTLLIMLLPSAWRFDGELKLSEVRVLLIDMKETVPHSYCETAKVKINQVEELKKTLLLR
jgi:hypothetical protein